MVTGVNTGYYNYYNNYQYGLQAQQAQQAQQTTFTGAQSTTTASTAQKTSEDGKDDGHISFWSKLKNIGKGVVKFATGMFTDENGHFSLGQTLKTAAIAVGVGAVCVLTAGTAVPAMIATAGVAASGIGFGKAAIKAATAETDAEAEQAWQSLGSNGVALGLSVAGAKAVAKSAHAAEAAAGEFDGFSGTLKALKTTGKDAISPIKNAFSGVKEAYEGANIIDKVSNAAKHVKGNVTAQAEEFAGTVKGNFNKTIYGSQTKIADEAEAIDKQKASIKEKRDAITDKTSKEYQALDKKYNDLTAKQDAMREINSTKSWNEANTKIEANKASLKAKQEALAKATTPEAKAQLGKEISNLENTIKTQENILSRRMTEVKGIDNRIETLEKQQKKIDWTKDNAPTRNAKLQSEIDALKTQRANADFELPSKAQVKTAKIESNRAKSNLDHQVKLQQNAAKEYGVNPDNIDKAILKQYNENVTSARQAYTKAQSNYNTLNNAASTKFGYNKQVASEILRASKAELTKGGFVENIKNQTNPSQWLSVGIAGRQFGETPEYRFYSQLSPEEQAYYRQLSTTEKANLTQIYQNMTA